jgi:hypothetical protein
MLALALIGCGGAADSACSPTVSKIDKQIDPALRWRIPDAIRDVAKDEPIYCVPHYLGDLKKRSQITVLVSADCQDKDGGSGGYMAVAHVFQDPIDIGIGKELTLVRVNAETSIVPDEEWREKYIPAALRGNVDCQQGRALSAPDKAAAENAYLLLRAKKRDRTPDAPIRATAR